MSDADRIGKLGRWSKPYRKMVEGYADNESLADDVMMSLKKDIQRYGNSPIFLLKEAAIRLATIQNNSLIRSTHNWMEDDIFIRNLAAKHRYQGQVNKRGMEIAIGAFKDITHKLRNGQPVSGDLSKVLIGQYIQNIYGRNFVDTFEVQTRADGHIVRQKIDEIGCFVDDGMASLVSQIAKKDDIKTLRVARFAIPIPINLETEIISWK